MEKRKALICRVGSAPHALCLCSAEFSLSGGAFGLLFSVAQCRTATSLMEPRFEQALGQLQNLLLDTSANLQVPIRFGLIGGLAVAAWGAVRATADIDFLAHSDPSPLRNLAVRQRMKSFFESRRCAVDWRVGDADDPIPLLLRLRLPSPIGLGADVLWAHKRWQREALARAVKLRLSAMDVSVLHPEDLILLKLTRATIPLHDSGFSTACPAKIPTVPPSASSETRSRTPCKFARLRRH